MWWRFTVFCHWHASRIFCFFFSYGSCQSFETVNTEAIVTQCGIAKGAFGLHIIVSDIVNIPILGSYCHFISRNSPSILSFYFLPNFSFLQPSVWNELWMHFVFILFHLSWLPFLPHLRFTCGFVHIAQSYLHRFSFGKIVFRSYSILRLIYERVFAES